MLRSKHLFHQFFSAPGQCDHGSACYREISKGLAAQGLPRSLLANPDQENFPVSAARPYAYDDRTSGTRPNFAQLPCDTTARRKRDISSKRLAEPIVYVSQC